MGVRRFTELRAWQACDAYKKAVYRLRDSHPHLRGWRRWPQFEDSVGVDDRYSQAYWLRIVDKVTESLADIDGQQAAALATAGPDCVARRWSAAVP